MIEIRNLESPEDWGKALERVPHATLFHSRKWLDCIARTHKLESFLGGVYRGQELLGLFPIMIRTRGPFRIAGSPQGFSGSMTPYLGPAVPNEMLTPTLEAFERWQIEQHIDYTELTLDREADRAIWDSLGYEHRGQQTVWLEVPANEGIAWKAMTKGCRGAVRKAESSGVEIVEVSDQGFFNTYLDMAADVYRKSHRPPPIPLAFYHAAWDNLRPSGSLRVLAAFRKREVLAAAIFLFDPEPGRAYYLDGVSYWRHREFCANNLVQWIVIQELVQNKFSSYDMLGGNHEGIRRYKLSFGGSVRAYDYVFKARTSLARIAREGYRRLAPAARFVKYHLGREASDRSKS